MTCLDVGGDALMAGGEQGVTSPLAGQMFFRATLFGAFGWAKRWLATNADGSERPLTTLDFYKARRLSLSTAMHAGHMRYMHTRVHSAHKSRMHTLISLHTYEAPEG